MLWLHFVHLSILIKNGKLRCNDHKWVCLCTFVCDRVCFCQIFWQINGAYGIQYMQLWVQRHISFTSNVIIDIIYHSTGMFNFINTIQWIFNRIESQRALLCLYRTHCQIVFFVSQTQLIPSLLMLDGGAFLLSLGFTYPIFSSSCITYCGYSFG